MYTSQSKARRYASNKDALCCCEYVDHIGETNHILACCCDCSALDSVCDRFLTCQSVPSDKLVAMFSTVEDRLRIPWISGAVKVSLDVAIPVVVIPMGILLGTLHVALTILVLVFMPLTLLTTYRVWLRQKRKARTKLFYAWGFTSLVQMYLTFQFVVVLHREVLLWENLLLVSLILVMFYAFYHAKKDPGIIRKGIYSSSQSSTGHSAKNSANHSTSSNKASLDHRQCCQDKSDGSAVLELQDEEDLDDSVDKKIGPVGHLLMENFGLSKQDIQDCIDKKQQEMTELSHTIGAVYVSWVDSRMIQDGRVAKWCKSCQLVKPARAGHCPACNVCIQARDHHCVWIDSCIGANNHRSFFFAVVLFVVSGCYGIHLTLTTLCSPDLYLGWFLLPADCRFMYQDFPTALCFVSVLYSICAVVGISLVLITQCLLISQNCTSHEMHTSSYKGWNNGFCVQNHTLNRGFRRNWAHFLRGRRTELQEYVTQVV